VRRLTLAFCLAALLTACSEPEPEPSATVEANVDAWFESVPEAAGIDFTHVRAVEPRFWFPEIMSGGGAWLDYDGDGDLDAYLVQGGDLEGRGEHGNRLYRNDGEGGFVDVTEVAGVGDRGYGMGAVVGDLDADGDADLYVTNVGPNTLYRNDGNGSFTRVPGGDAAHDSWGVSGAAVDYDRDGDLDLYVVNYVTWSPEIETDCYGVGGSRDYCHPSRYQAPASDTLLRNDGNMRFTDVSEETGLLTNFGNGLGVAVVDITEGSAPDIYVANDGMPNQLWIWSGSRFGDEAVPRGCAVNALGVSEAGMGVAHGDVDGDGRLDLVLTHLARETNTLYLNREGTCEDVTATAGLGAPSLPFTGFGTALADFDHDGEIDLWVSNGRVGREDIGTEGDPFAEPDHLYRGLGGTRFELLSASVSGVGRTIDNSRGAAFGDYDYDGDVDALVIENGGAARLHRNRAAGGGWLQLGVLFEGSHALGARVEIEADGSRRAGVVQRAYSYGASHDPRVHFGLGTAERVEELHVRTVDGGSLTLHDLPGSRSYRLELP
jgi:hypothetical protein